jgi:hypothetical protein
MSLPISVLDRKRLWGRSGMRCAICQVSLAAGDELGGSTIIGQEAHIVARSSSGPRGESPLTAKQRDSYSNLILLCPTDHAKIDSQPYGVAEYTVEKLVQIKKRHEEAVLANDQVDRKAQVTEEQWAALIDRLNERMGWDSWTEDLSELFDPNLYRIKYEVTDRLDEASRWIIGRAWPGGHERLRRAIETVPPVFYDLHGTFAQHSEPSRREGYSRIPRFYNMREWNPEAFERRHKEYDDYMALVQDLALELTRYGNYIAALVREEIDPYFRFEEGLLLIVVGPTESLSYVTIGPQFSDSELSGGQPYQNPEQFREVRSSRIYSAKRWLDGGVFELLSTTDADDIAHL